MTITPNDILNKEFATKFRGYDPDQVNDYLDIIVAEFETVNNENHRIQNELSAAREKNEYFAQLQDSLNSSIVVAQEAAERLKQNARKEAELIIYEAEREADRIINKASDTAKSIVTESDALRRSSKSYRAKLEQMISQQLNLVTSEEYVRLFDEEMDTQFNPEHFQEANQRANERVDRLEEEDANGFNVANDIAESYKDHEDDFNDVESTESYDDLEETRVHNFDLSKELEQEYSEQQADTEDILGQTIRIDLPKN